MLKIRPFIILIVVVFFFFVSCKSSDRAKEVSTGDSAQPEASKDPLNQAEYIKKESSTIYGKERQGSSHTPTTSFDTLISILIKNQIISLNLDLSPTIIEPLTDTVAGKTTLKFQRITQESYQKLKDYAWRDQSLVYKVNQTNGNVTKNDSCYIVKLKNSSNVSFCSTTEIWDDQKIHFPCDFKFYHPKTTAALFRCVIREGEDFYLTFSTLGESLLIRGIPMFSPDNKVFIVGYEDWSYLNNVFEVYNLSSSFKPTKLFSYCCSWSTTDYYWLDKNHFIFKRRNQAGDEDYILAIVEQTS